MNRVEKNRIIFVFTCFCLFFLLVLGKAFKVQLIDAGDLIVRANSQFLRQATVYPKRGNIYDRSGHPLALNVQTYSIFTIPKSTDGKNDVYKKLAKIVPELSYKEMITTIKKRKRFTWLGRKLRLSKDQVEDIKELKGIFIEGTPERTYPNHELLSQVIGFVGLDNSGLSGLEYMYNKELRGNPVTLKYTIDNKGRAIKFESHQDVTAQAKDIYLTIDKDIQGMAEKYLKEAVLKHNADKGGIGVIDATTGEILAIANYPTFDPNNVKGSAPESRKLSFAIDPFEPGSTFKIFTAASALEHKTATINSTYYAEQGRMRVDNHWIKEAESHEKFEWISVADIIRYSSNVGTTKLAFDLTFPKLKETLKELNFGNKTGIEVPGESRGIFTEADNVTPLSLSNISFGQGIAVTGVQMMAAYAAIANGGEYIKPTLIKRDPNQVTVSELEPENANQLEKRRRVLSQKNTEDLTKALVLAVEKGTGGNAKIPHFQIAGKTATAQRVDKNGGYKGYVSGFIGYPVNVDRKFVIAVYIDNPKTGGYYGGAVAGPVFKNLAEYMLYKNKDISRLAEHEDNDYDLKKVKTNIDMVQVKEAASRSLTPGIVPNMMGLDKITTTNISLKLNLQVVHKGMGVVSSQYPPAGTPIGDDTVVKLEYSPPTYE
nr:penicillin-binding transpeptidase domain-containing protein [Bacteriovorax sp. HI3]